jgi:outer membrane receptor for ferrienterochelin and colicins
MNNKHSLFFHLLFLSFFLGAQPKLRVLSEEWAQPVIGAEIRIESEKEMLVKTDERGYFLLPLEWGTKFSGRIFIKHPDYFPFTDSIRAEKSAVFYLRKIGALQALDEVVVTGQSHAVQANNAVQKIHVINRQLIEQKGAVNLRDVLQNELNIRVSQDAILGSGLSIKGVGNEGIKILLDGVPIVGRNDGAIDLSQLNLANIERIELVDGPLSVQYGSNAIGGTINLISKKSKSRKTEIGMHSYYETNGHYNLGANFNLSKGKWSGQGHLGRQFFAGWKEGDAFVNQPFSQRADSSRFKSWKPKEQFTVGNRWTYQGKKWQLTTFVEGMIETILNRGFPRAPYQIVAFDETYQTNRWNQGVDWGFRPTDKWTIKGQMAFQHYKRIKNVYVTDLSNLQRTLTNVLNDQDTNVFNLIFARFTAAPVFSKDWMKLELGTEINHETGFGQRLQGQSQFIGDYALFGVSDFFVYKKTVLQPALRLNYNTAYGIIAVPSFHAKIPFGNTMLRANYARGFRTPSLKELYLEFVDINHNILGNPDLNPEKSHFAQLWWTRNDTLGKWTFVTELNPFAQWIQNKISLAQTPSSALFTYFNLEEFRSVGIQASFSVKKGQWLFRTGASYLGMKTNFHVRTHFTPEITANFQYQIPGSAWSFHAFYKYTGKIDAFVLNQVQEITNVRMEDYHLLDVQLQIQTKNRKLRCQIGGKNLLNVQQINALNAGGGVHSNGSTALIGTGRTIYTGIVWNIISKND